MSLDKFEVYQRIRPYVLYVMDHYNKHSAETKVILTGGAALDYYFDFKASGASGIETEDYDIKVIFSDREPSRYADTENYIRDSIILQQAADIFVDYLHEYLNTYKGTISPDVKVDFGYGGISRSTTNDPTIKESVRSEQNLVERRCFSPPEIIPDPYRTRIYRKKSPPEIINQLLDTYMTRIYHGSEENRVFIVDIMKYINVGGNNNMFTEPYMSLSDNKVKMSGTEVYIAKPGWLFWNATMMRELRKDKADRYTKKINAMINCFSDSSCLLCSGGLSYMGKCSGKTNDIDVLVAKGYITPEMANNLESKYGTRDLVVILNRLVSDTPQVPAKKRVAAT